MRSFVFLMITFFSLFSFAQKKAATPMASPARAATPASAPSNSSLKFYLADLELRYEKSSDLEWTERWPFNIAAGFSYQRFDFILEYSRFSESTGNATLGFDRTHTELVAWMRLQIYKMQTTWSTWNLYGGLGVGAYEETITTTAGGSRQTDEGGKQWMSGLALGLESQIPLRPRLGILTAIEGRVLTASDFEPNPLGSGVLRLGLYWNL